MPKPGPEMRQSDSTDARIGKGGAEGNAAGGDSETIDSPTSSNGPTLALPALSASFVLPAGYRVTSPTTPLGSAAAPPPMQYANSKEVPLLGTSPDCNTPKPSARPPRVKKMDVQEPTQGIRPPFLSYVSKGIYEGDSGMLCCALHTEIDANAKTVTTRSGCLCQKEETTTKFRDVHLISRDSCGGMAITVPGREFPTSILHPRYCCCVTTAKGESKGEPGLAWVTSLLTLNGAKAAESKYYAPSRISDGDDDDACGECCWML